MNHYLATPRAVAVAAVETGWQREADALRGARRLLGFSVAAILALAATVLGATVFAVFHIDDAAVEQEMSRARAALTAVLSDAPRSETQLAGVLSETFVLDGAHIGEAASVVDDEVSLAIPGKEDRLLIWTPRRLGTELFAQLAPIRIFTSLVFLAGIAFLMRRLYRVARELEGRRVEAHTLATRDPLTGLGNRLAFDRGIESMLTQQGTRELALLYLDLDGFKQVNDTLGHGAGDDVLKTVGRRLTALAQPGDLLVRLGGDEFVMVRANHGSADELARLARTIEAALIEPVQLGTRALRIGVSIGTATAPSEGVAGNALLEAADRALYRSKRGRRSLDTATAA